FRTHHLLGPAGAEGQLHIGPGNPFQRLDLALHRLDHHGTGGARGARQRHEHPHAVPVNLHPVNETEGYHVEPELRVFHLQENFLYPLFSERGHGITPFRLQAPPPAGGSPAGFVGQPAAPVKPSPWKRRAPPVYPFAPPQARSPRVPLRRPAAAVQAARDGPHPPRGQPASPPRPRAGKTAGACEPADEGPQRLTRAAARRRIPRKPPDRPPGSGSLPLRPPGPRGSPPLPPSGPAATALRRGNRRGPGGT